MSSAQQCHVSPPLLKDYVHYVTLWMQIIGSVQLSGNANICSLHLRQKLDSEIHENRNA